MLTPRRALVVFAPLATVFLFSARLVDAQALGPIVETPTIRNVPADAQAYVDENVTIGREDKNVIRDYKDMVDNKSKEVVEQQATPSVHWYVVGGYESQYNFRGVDLMPHSDGAFFVDAEVSVSGFTFGVYEIHQIGTAHVNGFSLGEGGGGGAQIPGFFSPAFPTTVQSDFNEVDLFLQYHRKVGPVDITVGDVGFFITRNAQTFVNLPDLGIFSGVYGPFPTVGDEQFDRLFATLSTSVIPHLTVSTTYYQTIYSDGQDPFFHKAFRMPPAPFNEYVFYNAFERSTEDYGGYLTGRINGNFPICQWVDFNPYGVLSYSFGDRTEPDTAANTTFQEQIRGRPLRGFNTAETGLELPIHVIRRSGKDIVNLVPFGAYSYHISTPPPGTNRDEFWAGVKLALSF